MKEMSELNLPGTCRFSDDHEWACRRGDVIRIGISDFAQDQLGDIVYVELPQVGRTIEYNEEFGTVESVKAVSELLAPVSGEVAAVNEKLLDSPDLVNSDPYGTGWMIEVKVDDYTGFEGLMDVDDYRSFLTEEH